MANHKWKDESFSKLRKQESCIKCGLHRDWLYGDMQCWEYWHSDVSKNIIIRRNKFTRPECINEKYET